MKFGPLEGEVGGSELLTIKGGGIRGCGAPLRKRVMSVFCIFDFLISVPLRNLCSERLKFGPSRGGMGGSELPTN